MKYLTKEELERLDHLEEHEDGIIYAGSGGDTVSLQTWQRLVTEIKMFRAKSAEDRSCHGR